MYDFAAVDISKDASCCSLATEHAFQVYTCDPVRRKILKEFVNFTFTNIATIDDGTHLAFSGIADQAGSQKRQKVFLWNNFFGECILQIDFKEEVVALYLRPKLLLVVLVSSVCVYDIPKSFVQVEMKTTTNTYGAGDLSEREGKLLVGVCGDIPGQLKIIDPFNIQHIVTISAHQHALSMIRFSPDSSFVATASEKGTLIRVFDSTTGQLLSVFRRGALSSTILTLCFSPNNSQLIAVSNNGTIHLFDMGNSSGNISDPPRAISKLKIDKATQADAVFRSDNEFLVLASSGHLHVIKTVGKVLTSVNRFFVLAH